MQLEGRARGEDQGRVERNRGAAVGHAAVVAGGSLKHEGGLRDLPVTGLRWGMPGKATTMTGPPSWGGRPSLELPASAKVNCSAA